MKIAIQGHPTRGEEVIQILEGLGGNNLHIMTGSTPDCAYYINSCYNIDGNPLEYVKQVYQVYTLEEFEKEFPFKIGDKVITTDGTIGIIDKLKPGEDHPYCIKADVGGFYWCVTSILKPYKEMKEERNITLTLDKAKEWYKKGGDLKQVALQAYSEEELNPIPRTWEEFCRNYPLKTSEAIIGTESTIVTCDCSEIRDSDCDREICPSKKSAEAHLALIQLEQLRDCWRQGWEPDWNDDQQAKYCIIRSQEFKIHILYTTRRFLSFPTIEMAEEFLSVFRDLIEKAEDLI